ncbi:GH36 C-terminal domain-containing protein, partial [bacterium]|nr:GH36 C-terminal domain-containing protein [bacterium]
GTIAFTGAPYYGSGKTPVEPYAFWSNVTPATGSGIDMREKEIDYPAFRRLINQWREHVAANYYGDYYPLTPYSQESTAWMAWQFNRPEEGKGVVQAFRRQDSPQDTVRLKLRGLDPEAKYTVGDLDVRKPQELSGRELMEKGLSVTISDRPGAAVITYTRS